jgi:group II intron reverse transcriptase/maturase
MSQIKSFIITKRQVWEAYKKVRRNKGSAGVDGIDFEKFEEDLENNLYKLWNRMSAGSYMPSAVLRVEIPKSDGGVRALGIPTITDRVAQMVVKNCLEPKLEKIFDKDSYGYRPNKSAHEALKQTKERCTTYPFVLDLDIKGFFDNIDHELMIKALELHVDTKWEMLYLKRWLVAPVQTKDGLLERDKGTPQGGVISPLLANLFLHYAFDVWMRKNYISIPFERYADDAVCHCKSEEEAKRLESALKERLKVCKLELHPKKTKIVYCKDMVRKQEYENIKFDFLGYTFQPRVLKSRKGNIFVRFHPAMSRDKAKKIRQTIKGWKIHLKSETDIKKLSKLYSPIIRGWINYYSLFEKYTIKSLLERHFDTRVAKWAKRKFKKLRRRNGKTYKWLSDLKRRDFNLFPHWQLQYAYVKND